MANDNLPMATIAFKGPSKPNAIAVYHDTGAWMLGGFASPSDPEVVRFGRVVSELPGGTDGEMFMGIPSGNVAVGIVIYEGGIAQNDPSRLGDAVTEYLPGQPMAIMQIGQFWMATFTTTAPGSIQPVLGAVCIVDTTTGAVEFLPNGSLVGAVPAGFALAPQLAIKSVSLDTSGVLLLANF